MEPLFDSDCTLVGWLSNGKHIFDTDLNWRAYISSGHLWSEATGNWCGPIHGTVCLDTNGKVLAWSPGASISGTARPARPARAAKAARPARPARPVGGWSTLSFEQWVNQ